jgi:hypothetical protein
MKEEIEEEPKNDKPWLWKKGVSANPKGRPKGKTMKEYAREFLSKMNEEERQEFMDGLSKEVIWKMAEGNPMNNVDANVRGELHITLDPIIAKKNGTSSSPTTDSK